VWYLGGGLYCDLFVCGVDDDRSRFYERWYEPLLVERVFDDDVVLVRCFDGGVDVVFVVGFG